MIALADSLHRTRRLDPHLPLGIGRPSELAAEGWVTPSALTAADGARLTELLARTGAQWKTADRRVQASFLVGQYAWSLVGGATVLYLAERRLPKLDHDNTEVWLGPGEEGHLGLRSGQYVAVAGDGPNDPDAITVPDSAALRDALHDQVVRHLAPVVEAIRAATPLGTRALWLGVADQLGWGLQHAGRVMGNEARGIAEAQDLLSRPGSPLASPRSRFVTYVHRGTNRTLKVRGQCCLAYRIEGMGYCMSCPLIDETDRAGRVHAWIDEELAQVPTASAGSH